jgi:hypothetical protein
MCTGPDFHGTAVACSQRPEESGAMADLKLRREDWPAISRRLDEALSLEADAARGGDGGCMAHGVLQHVVGMREGLLLRHVVAQHFKQLLVEHDDEARKLNGGRQAVRSSVRAASVWGDDRNGLGHEPTFAIRSKTPSPSARERQVCGDECELRFG